jgi:hypothetical protein
MSKVLDALFVFGLVTAIPAAGYPCRDYDFISRSEGAALIAEAEKAFEAGEYGTVLDLLDNGIEMSDWRHGNKRMELVAIANVRTGKVQAGVKSLRYLLRQKKDDPYLLTRLAEGLALTESGKTEAIAILEKLEKQDLVADGDGKKVLVALRRS